MAALDHAVEFACRGVQPGQRRRRAQRAWPRSADRRHRHRRDQHPRRADEAHRAASPSNGGLGLVGIVGVQSNEFPRAVDIARPLREAGIQVMIGGFHVSGLPVDAARDPRRYQGRRRRSASRSSPAKPRSISMRSSRTPRAAAAAALQLHEGPAGYRRHRLAALPALRFRAAHRRQRDQLRCRPRLPLPMLVLHHHQRAGTQIALSHAGQRRAHPAHELGAGRQPLLHHRRQFRPQQGLGSDLRPHHQAARRGRHGRPLHDPGRHALPPHPELHREIAPRRRHPRVHRAGEHQPGQSDRRQEAAEQDHRVPQDAARMEAVRHHDLRRLHSRLPATTRRSRSATTSTSSRKSCRSTCSSSSC